jgi:inositol phosphorylceramide mannosyltransferase catalytic subunit
MLVYRPRRIRILVPIVFCVLLARKHLYIGLSLALTPLIFTFGDDSMRLSLERDNFDVTFQKYPSQPDPDTANDPSYQVPPIIHNIFLGPRGAPRVEWDEAVDACRKYHPGYTFEHWNDSRAAEFVKQEYPEIWPTWEGYKYHIQRADSLRYMILHSYGGKPPDIVSGHL